MPVLNRDEERELLLGATKKALDGLRHLRGADAIRSLLQTTLDIIEPPPLKCGPPDVEIGAFNELGIKEIASLLDVELATFCIWIRDGFPVTWKLKIEPFPKVQRMNGQVRLWNGPAVAKWCQRNAMAVKLCYKRNKMTSGK